MNGVVIEPEQLMPQQAVLVEPDTEELGEDNLEMPAQPIPQQQPAAGKPAKKEKKPRSEKGTPGGWVYAINRPWLLVGVAFLVAGMYVANHPELITSNINQPYALLAGPVFVASIVAGWMILKFFTTIQNGWNALKRAWKEDGSAQFFWIVIIVFMIVSVFASGEFFSKIEKEAVPGLGYVTALFIDLVAVQSMRARLNAVRMRDRSGAFLYLFGVLVCSIASAFANVYTSLSTYTDQATGVLPTWMNNVAPWFGLVFPALILLLSITADYTLDQTSTKLDPDAYRKQEEKRVKMMEVQLDMTKKRVEIEQEIDELSSRLKRNKERRVFFLTQLLWPKENSPQQLDTQKIVDALLPELLYHFQQANLQPALPSSPTQLAPEPQKRGWFGKPKTKHNNAVQFPENETQKETPAKVQFHGNETKSENQFRPQFPKNETAGETEMKLEFQKTENKNETGVSFQFHKNETDHENKMKLEFPETENKNETQFRPQFHETETDDETKTKLEFRETGNFDETQFREEFHKNETGTETSNETETDVNPTESNVHEATQFHEKETETENEFHETESGRETANETESRETGPKNETKNETQFHETGPNYETRNETQFRENGANSETKNETENENESRSKERQTDKLTALNRAATTRKLSAIAATNRNLGEDKIRKAIEKFPKLNNKEIALKVNATPQYVGQIRRKMTENISA